MDWCNIDSEIFFGLSTENNCRELNLSPIPELVWLARESVSQLHQPETGNIVILWKTQFELFNFKRDGLTSMGIEAYLFNNDHSSIGGPTNVWQISTGADYQSKSTVCWMFTDDRSSGKNNIWTNRMKI